MAQRPNLPRHARWAVPAGVLAAAGGMLAASAISVAAAPPPLPARTAGQLLAAVDDRASAPSLTGTVTETASLGLPALPSAAGTSSLQSLLTGSNTIRVWYSDPAHYRLEMPQAMSESDLIRNGGSLWLWESSANQVTHVTVPPDAQAPSVPSMPVTPQQAAAQALARVGATTTVQVGPDVTVAGEPAYELVLAPKNPDSLIGEVRIAIDSAHSVPLRVQVFAKKADSPAFQVAYTSISFTRPPAANFAFTPPPGATVVQEQTQSGKHAGSGKDAGGAAQGSDLLDGSSLIGSGWLTVADLPESSVSGLTGGPSSAGSVPFSGSAQASASPGGTSPGLDTGAIFSALLRSATPVSGSWGTGHLLRTGLLSILFTSKGRVLIGSVTPDVLYRAAAVSGKTPAKSWQHVATPAPSR